MNGIASFFEGDLKVEWKFMARKPNYRFERHERERIKAAKKAAKREAKAEKKDGSETVDTVDGNQPSAQDGEA